MAESRLADHHVKLQQLFTAVFMLSSLDRTITTETLDRIVRDARLRARRDAAKMKPSRRPSIDHDAIGHLIFYWQRTPEYLDESGNPLPLPARGPAPSLEALFKKLKMKRPIKLALSDLKSLRRVRLTRSGLYLPRAEATIIPTLTPEVVTSLTQTIHNLVATVFQNTSMRSKRTIRLIERAAFVPDLPKSRVADFKLFAREQAGGVVETVNDWLENQRGRNARMPHAPGRIAAGLHVFAFVKKRAGS